MRRTLPSATHKQIHANRINNENDGQNEKARDKQIDSETETEEDYPSPFVS